MGISGVYARISQEVVEQVRSGKIHAFKLLDSIEDNCILDIYKLWHVVDFALVGNSEENSDDPLAKVVLGGGIPIEDEDAGILLKTPEEISEVNQAITTVSEKFIRDRFSLSEMRKENIYLAEAFENEDQFVKEVYEIIKIISRFFKAAEQNKQWILLIIG